MKMKFAKTLFPSCINATVMIVASFTKACLPEPLHNVFEDEEE